MQYTLGKSVFISYRGKYFLDASSLRDFLIRDHWCKQVVLFPPNALCAPNEVLMPYEYVEIMGRMRDVMSGCDAFVYLNTNDYEWSYFTQTELLQWRLYKKAPIVYGAIKTNGRFIIQQPITLEMSSNNEKGLWAKIAVGIDRSQRSKFNPGFHGGKYNRNCYLVGCEGCGQYFLISKKRMASVLKNDRRVLCPHTRNHHVEFTKLEHMGNFYRKPIVITTGSFSKHVPIRVLQASEVTQLLIENKLPITIPLLKEEGEHLDGDLMKVGKGYLGLAALGAAVMGIAALYDAITKPNDSKEP